MAAVEERAQERGLQAITLNATLSAVTFYEGKGYSAEGPKAYILPGGVELACVRRQKALARSWTRRVNGHRDK